jgi:hypothetical protein
LAFVGIFAGDYDGCLLTCEDVGEVAYLVVSLGVKGGAFVVGDPYSWSDPGCCVGVAQRVEDFYGEGVFYIGYGVWLQEEYGVGGTLLEVGYTLVYLCYFEVEGSCAATRASLP